jgi:hypothetical protein
MVMILYFLLLLQQAAAAALVMAIMKRKIQAVTEDLQAVVLTIMERQELVPPRQYKDITAQAV